MDRLTKKFLAYSARNEIMTSFTFQTTRSLIVEPGSSVKVGALMAELGSNNVLLVTDRGIMDLNLAQSAIKSFAEVDINVSVFDGVVSDPHEAVIMSALAEATSKGIDGVVGLGGGSSMDVAKVLAFLLGSDQSLAEIYGIQMCRGNRVPLILVPTTAGTGSEVTPISIVTTGDSEKKGIVSQQLLPDWAVLDANLTLGLPKHTTAATGIDAMVHAIEAYTSKLKKNPMSDCLAKEALRLLGANIRLVCDDGSNGEARSKMLLGSMLAGMAFTNAPVAAVHALAYPLGGHFHVAHGLSNSLVLPHVIRFNIKDSNSAYSELGPILFPNIQLTPVESMGMEMADCLAGLAEDLGLETRLRDVGVSHNQIPMLAEDAMKQTRLLVNNPRKMTYEAALKIYREAY